MQIELTLSLVAFALVTTTCVCSCAQFISRKLSLIDAPGGALSRKRHHKPTPLVGGMAVVPVSLVAMLVLAAFPSPGSMAPFLLLSLLTASMLVIGILDDRHNLRARPRFVLSAILIFGAVVAVPEFRMETLRFTFMDSPLELGWLGGALLTSLAVLGFQNAVNMADGRNGLVTGLSIVWSALLFPNAPPVMQQILAVLAVALMVVFAFNMRGKLFLGDGGSYSISVLLAFLSLYSFNNPVSGLPSSDMLVLFFLVPVLDTLRLIWMRLSRKRTPFQPDRRHLHHFLGEAMPWTMGLGLYLGMIALPGALALAMPAWTAVFVVLSGLSYVAVLRLCARKIRSNLLVRVKGKAPRQGAMVVVMDKIRRRNAQEAPDFPSAATVDTGRQKRARKVV